jgi:hypothetical protein
MIFTNMLQQEQFDRDGYLVVDFLSVDEVEQLLHLHNRFEQCLMASFDASMMSRDLNYRQTVDAEIKEIFSVKLSSTLRDYRLCSCGYAVKKAQHDTNELPIHQDWSFVDETRFESLGIWCPLIDVGRGNGCLRVVRGSHRLNGKPRGMTTPPAYKELFSSIDDRCFTYVTMRAGQAILFSQRLFHGSTSNGHEQDRVAAYGILVPIESELLFHFQDLANNPDKLEVFHVSDNFLTKYFPGAPLDDESLGARRLGLIDYEFEPITREQLMLMYLTHDYGRGTESPHT